MNAALVRSSFPLALLFLLLTSCGGGSPSPIPPGPPEVGAVRPANLVATWGSQVRFIAPTEDPNATFSWDFGDGATPQLSTEREPLVELISYGNFTGTVVVCGETCSDPITFQYRGLLENSSFPPIPWIESIAPTGTVGKRGKSTTFFAKINGKVDAWEWDFGTGATPTSSTDAEPTVVLGAPGTYEGSLTVSLEGRQADSFAFAYRVTSDEVAAPPRIERIIESGKEYCDNRRITLRASVVSDLPVTYDWTINGGGTPTITNNSVCRFTSQLPFGEYSGELRTSNDRGSATPAPFTFTVFDCPDASIERVFPTDQPQGPVYFTSHFNKPASHTSLIVDSPGFSASTGAYSDKIAYLPESGTLTGHLDGWSFNSGFPGDPASFSEVVTHPNPIPQWNRILTVDNPFSSIGAMAIKVRDGRPIVFFSQPSGGLECATALTPNPMDSADWSIHRVANLIRADSLTIYPGDGRPVLVWQSSTTTILAVATQEFPTEQAHWTTLGIPELSQVSLVSGAMPDGRLLFMGTPGNGLTPLEDRHPVIATCGPHPQSDVDFVVTHPFDAQVPAFASNAVAWQDRWVLVFRNFDHQRTFVATAQTPAPLLESDWSYYVLDALDDHILSAFDIALIPTPDRLWACATFEPFPFSSKPTEGKWISTSALPLSNNDWTALSVWKDVFTPRHSPLSAVVDNRMLEVRADFENQAWLYRALTTTPSQSSDWYKLVAIDTEHQPLSPANIGALGADGNQLYLVTRDFTPDSSYEVWTTTLTW